MTTMIDRQAARESARAKAILGLLTAVVAATAALVAYFVTANTRWARADELRGVSQKVEQHDALIGEIHDDLHWTRDQLFELTKSLGLRPAPLPKH